MFQKCAPNVLVDIALHHHERESKISPDLRSQRPELRCVFALIRHGLVHLSLCLPERAGDRTPKQKMKMDVSDARLLSLFDKYAKDVR